MSGRVTSIDVVRDQPHIIFAGAASGGLWKSTNGGINWKPVFDDERVQSIGSVAIYQANPAIVWAGTGEGNPRNSQTSGYGIYRSLDGGESWKLMGLEETKNIHRILIDPTNPDIIYAGAIGYAWAESEHRGVYKSVDGGKTWSKILFVNNATGVADMVMDPSNPNKIIAAMWEYRRWPWFFKSGGEGSGLYITYDGGENWEELDHEDGLPKGELGRIGLAFATNKINVVYAMIEAEKENALFRSDDGGKTWKKTVDATKDPNMGNRPFYYSDIFVDPSNENRIFSLWSYMSVSEDGGKSFSSLYPYYNWVHPDHHAFYIHPDNPNFMINGNDGGLNFSYDGGKSWRFAPNLPLAQFYHINYDMEWPYNVYGGMQDNGSWRGPAYTWDLDGIMNAKWQELYFGDGFDVVPDPEDSRYGWAMSQGGNLGRYDHVSGYTKRLKPNHPDGEELRFNWNAAIAIDPTDPNTIYYGSQYVHKSTDKGENWTIISSDLTTNDPDKQKYGESGGLTYDVTGAENYTSITAIDVSPKDSKVIWAGTDDGRVHVSDNGGNSWTEVTKKMKGLPDGSWIHQIVASPHNRDEVYIVANDYRRGDWKPYIYRSTNLGKKFDHFVNDKDVWGYTLSFVQDFIEPNLMFVGTEFGLYVSIDGGKAWTQWTEGYPKGISTIDLKIHPREHDLIVGTFGRAAYIFDDIRPLRALAKEGKSLLDNELVAFDAPTAVLAEYKQPPGMRFDADGEFNGENRPSGAMITYWVKTGTEDRKKEKSEKDGEDSKSFDKVKIEITDASGSVIRTLYETPETGMNRLFWDLEMKGVRGPGQPEPKDENRSDRGGAKVLPGRYSVTITYGDQSSKTSVEVVDDPRIETPISVLQDVLTFQKEIEAEIEKATIAMDRVRSAEKSISLIEKQLDDDHKDLKKQTKAVKDSLKTLKILFLGDDSKKGIFRTSDQVSSKLNTARGLVSGSREVPNSNQKAAFEEAKRVLADGLAKVDAFFNTEWAAYKTAVENADISPFKE